MSEPWTRAHDRVRLDPAEQVTNLPAGTTELELGPEHVATVYIAKPR